MKVVTRHGVDDNFAQLLCVDAEDLKKIVENPLLVHDFNFIIKLLDKNGPHAVIARLELDNVAARAPGFIWDHMRELLRQFESVSWVHKDRLYTRRRVCATC